MLMYTNQIKLELCFDSFSLICIRLASGVNSLIKLNGFFDAGKGEVKAKGRCRMLPAF